MFKFEFHLQDPNTNTNTTHHRIPTTKTQDHTHPQPIQSTIPLSELIDRLPPFISYSSLRIHSNLSIYKRELYDAKYQFLLNLSEHHDHDDHDDHDDDPSSHQTLHSLQSTSDLIPGLYEGGFKTWESSLDLANYLDRSTSLLQSSPSTSQPVHHPAPPQKPFTILELGCGTAIPTVSLCFRLFDHLLKLDHPLQPSTSCPSQPNPPVFEIILQDFNSDVLSLLTFPNILLAFYRALLLNDQDSTRKHEGNQVRQSGRSEAGFVELKSEDDLEITEDLKKRFSDFIEFHRIKLTLVSGSWSNFELKSILTNPTGPCDLIISSETLYSIESIPDLIKILVDSRIRSDRLPTEQEENPTEILIASKSVYFGVGGGMNAFIKALQPVGGTVEFVDLTHPSSPHQQSDPLVRPISNGVLRVLMRVHWSP